MENSKILLCSAFLKFYQEIGLQLNMLNDISWPLCSLCKQRVWDCLQYPYQKRNNVQYSLSVHNRLLSLMRVSYVFEGWLHAQKTQMWSLTKINTRPLSEYAHKTIQLHCVLERAASSHPLGSMSNFMEGWGWILYWMALMFWALCIQRWRLGMQVPQQDWMLFLSLLGTLKCLEF